jgi:hypothetical protein
MNASIDKLVLTTREFIIKDSVPVGFNMNVPQGKKHSDLPVLYIDTGYGHKQIQANSLYFNHPDFYSTSVNQTGIQVIFNPSKILHPYKLASLLETNEVIKAVEKDLIKNGILLNIDSMMISRIDLAKQNLMIRDNLAYAPAFKFMNGKQMKSVQYEFGYRWGNKQHENTIYDKSKESNLHESNILRNEVKLKKTGIVRKRSGIHSIKQLIDSSDSYLTNLYNDYLNEKLFTGSYSEQLTFDFDNEVQRLKALKKEGRNAVIKWIASRGINSLIQELGSIEVLYQIISQAGFTKGTVSKEKDKIEELLKYSKGIQKISISALINELQRTFAA